VTDLLTRELPNATGADLAPAVLMAYQQRWLEDDAPLKVIEKSRRTGLTWAEAADNVIIAASAKSAGGDNVYYIGYSMDMAIEYIEACAMWARTFNRAAAAIEEGEEIFKEGQEDKSIKTYTIRFPESGHRIVALSSRPTNLRGKQGVVVIDEAAFHDKLDELLKAALALLIWGGRVRVISTHNGDENTFNTLINDIRAGRRSGSVHRLTFREAISDGLYRRVCLRLGKTWASAAEVTWVDSVYRYYGDDATEELDVVPKAGDGAFLTRAMIEATQRDVPVVRWKCDESFVLLSETQRVLAARDFCEEQLKPLLAALEPKRKHFYGADFARSGDLSTLWPLAQTQDLKLETPFVLELRNVPYEQQKQILIYLVRRLPRFVSGAHDARGNGGYLAEAAALTFGVARIAQVQTSETWYRENMPRVKARFEERTITTPRDDDIVVDLRAIVKIKGVAKVPDGAHTRGADGGKRHGDTAIACAMALFAHATMDIAPIEFESSGARSGLALFDEGVDVRPTDVGFGTIPGGNDFGGFA
jgi:phage FluMu gp28-like protein